MPEKEDIATVCLTDLDHFESLTARMPTEDECARGYPAGVPVIVVRKGARAGEMAYRSDLTEFTIDTTPAPDPEGTREAIRSVLHHVMEDMGNNLDTLFRLASATGRTNRDVLRVAAEREQWRKDQWDAYAALDRERYGSDLPTPE
jgi:hypothetical protein